MQSERTFAAVVSSPERQASHEACEHNVSKVICDLVPALSMSPSLLPSFTPFKRCISIQRRVDSWVPRAALG
jgi:hypothetical protein